MDRTSRHFSKSSVTVLHVVLFNTFFSVETPPFAGNKFTHSNPDWQEGTNEKFNDWAVGQFGLKELDSDEEAEVPVNMQKAKDISFQVNKRGHFVLPSIHDYRLARERQRVVRGYIGAIYSEFVGLVFFLFILICLQESLQDREQPPSHFASHRKRTKQYFLLIQFQPTSSSATQITWAFLK